MHSKTPALWYHKIKFNISKSIFDITKSILWYQKINLIFLYKKKIDFVIYIKKIVIPKKLHDLVISQIRFFDIIKSNFFFNKKFGLIWWYHKIIYVISKNHICDVTKSRWFLRSILWYYKVRRILNRRNDDSSVLPMLFFLYSRRYKI